MDYKLRCLYTIFADDLLRTHVGSLVIKVTQWSQHGRIKSTLEAENTALLTHNYEVHCTKSEEIFTEESGITKQLHKTT